MDKVRSCSGFRDGTNDRAWYSPWRRSLNRDTLRIELELSRSVLLATWSPIAAENETNDG